MVSNTHLIEDNGAVGVTPRAESRGANGRKGTEGRGLGQREPVQAPKPGRGASRREDGRSHEVLGRLLR